MSLQGGALLISKWLIVSQKIACALHTYIFLLTNLQKYPLGYIVKYLQLAYVMKS